MKKVVFGVLATVVFFMSSLSYGADIKVVSTEEIKVQETKNVEGLYLKVADNGWYVLFGSEYVLVIA